MTNFLVNLQSCDRKTIYYSIALMRADIISVLQLRCMLWTSKKRHLTLCYYTIEIIWTNASEAVIMHEYTIKFPPKNKEMLWIQLRMKQLRLDHPQNKWFIPQILNNIATWINSTTQIDENPNYLLQYYWNQTYEHKNIERWKSDIWYLAGISCSLPNYYLYFKWQNSYRLWNIRSI